MKRLTIFSAVLFFMLAIPLASFAGEVTITLEWDANSEDYLAGYRGYVADVAGGPYVEFADIPAPTVTVDYIYTAPDGQATTKFFVVTAYSNQVPPLESGYSNEVFMIYDFAPIVSATEFTAALDGGNIDFTWKQGDIERVKRWKLFFKSVAENEFEELAVIPYSGTPGEQYSTTQSISAPDGEMTTFTFALVTFNTFGVFSPNSVEASVTIDKRELGPVYNLRIAVSAE